MTSTSESPKRSTFAPFSTVLVTGASGFVGGHLVPAVKLHLKPCASLILASSTNAVGEFPGSPIRFDMEDSQSVESLISATRPDLVIHLAAQASVGVSLGAGRKTWSVNFGGSFTLAAALAKHSPDCTMLFASTAEIYGRAFNRGSATEATPPEPVSAYSRSKAAAEAMLFDVLPANSRLIVARASNHTGVGQSAQFVAPAFAEQIARIERVGGEMMVGNLDVERDMMDVRDVVSAYVALILAADHLPAQSTFNVASGQVITIRSVLDRLLALSSADVNVRMDPERARPSEILRAEVDASALQAATGWRPSHSLDACLAAILQDFRARLA